MSVWRTAVLCVKCKAWLNLEEEVMSRGRCPKCGNKGTSTSTIVETYDRGYRLLPRSAWWKLWETRKVEWAAKEE